MNRYEYLGIERFLSMLKNVKKSGNKGNAWMASCPTRKDTTQSMKITLAENGMILLNDYGGSSFTEITDALGLHPWVLIPETERRGDFQQDLNSPRRNRMPSRIELEELLNMTRFVMICASDTKRGKELSDETMDKLVESEEKLTDLILVLQGSVKEGRDVVVPDAEFKKSQALRKALDDTPDDEHTTTSSPDTRDAFMPDKTEGQAKTEESAPGKMKRLSF